MVTVAPSSNCLIKWAPKAPPLAGAEAKPRASFCRRIEFFLVKDGCAVAGSKVDVALSPIGMAVRTGTAVRDIRRGQETAASLHPDAGRRLIQYLAAPAAGPVLDWMGLQPVKHRRLGVGVGLTQAKAGI